MTKRLAGLLCLVGAWLACGCDRTHMGSGYGRAVRQAFHAQVDLTAGARPSRVQEGLDSEESAIVVKTYRRGLSPSKEQVQDSQKLLILPTAGQPGAYQPPQP